MIIDENFSRNFNTTKCGLKCSYMLPNSIYFLKKIFFLIMRINRSMLPFFSINSSINCLTVQFLEIDEIGDDCFQSCRDNYYFLSTNTCSLEKNGKLESCQTLSPKNYIKNFKIKYPSDTFFSSVFFDERILENQAEVKIYMNKHDFSTSMYLIEILKTEGNIFRQIKPQMVFEILKHLNIFRVKRDEKYELFIKTMVYYSMITDATFARVASSLILNFKDYNNFHVCDLIAFFFKSYFVSKTLIYELFTEYDPMEYTNTLYLHKKYKTYDEICFVMFRTCNLHKYLKKAASRCIWRNLIRVFFVDKVHVGFSDKRNMSEVDEMVALLPPHFKKITVAITKETLTILYKLHKCGFLNSKETVKVIFVDSISYEDFMKVISYFRNIEKLTLEFLKVYPDVIHYPNEEFKIAKSIKFIKIRIYRLFLEEIRMESVIQLFTRPNTIFIDLYQDIESLDSKTNLENFLTRNLKNFCIGFNIALQKESYNASYFTKIFDFNLIKRLKMDFISVKSNYLDSYEFLKSFIFLKNLVFKNIKLTNKLFHAILCSPRLISVWFDMFKVSEETNIDEIHTYNESIIYIGFKDLIGSPNENLFYFLNRNISLKFIYFRLHDHQTLKNSEALLNKRINDLHPRNSRKLPQLKSISYENISEISNYTLFSVLYVFSYFLNLENITELKYHIGSLCPDDIQIFSKLKTLRYLELSVQRKYRDLDTLLKILQVNIKNTIFKLDILVDKFEISEIQSILNFKKLKVLEVGIRSKDSNDKKLLKLLFNLNICRIDLYILEKSEYSYMNFSKKTKIYNDL
ncbi:hypothetical protein LUQ84_001268 [Hamiltosporidium tvaerminnensis]|nr:hypothetical protein LUQ84_001268 [Hamiltosporidium tvaerminnensis]